MFSSKQQRIAALRQKLTDDENAPLRKDATNAVLGEGNPYARIVLVGEAPGRNEDLRGEPFVGAAGRVLDNLLDDVGWSRDDIFITNIVNHRPPGNRDPQPDEIAYYTHQYLAPLLRIIEPTMLVTLGRHAMQVFLGDDARISQNHGTVHHVRSPSLGRIPVYPLYHPAAAIYNRSLLPTLKDDIQKLARMHEF